MGIRFQLFAALMVPIVLLWGIGIHAASTSAAFLRTAIEDSLADEAAGVGDEIDQILRLQIAQWLTYMESPLVQSQLRESNARYASMPDREASIDRDDAEWKAAPLGHATPMMARVLDHEISKDLRLRLAGIRSEAGPEAFPEVFLTNRYGALVASTNRTSDFRQDDEAWWQKACAGNHRVQELKYDESAAAYSADICLRVDDRETGEMLGVIKAVSTARPVIEALERRARQTRSYRIVLLTDDHRVIYSTREQLAPLSDGLVFLAGYEDPGDDMVFERTDPGTGQVLLSARARPPTRDDSPGPGWTVVQEQLSDEALAPASALWRTLLEMSILGTALALSIGTVLALNVSRRIRRLTAFARELGDGNLTARIDDRSGDTIGVLAGRFDDMAQRLCTARAELSRQAEEAKLRHTAILESASEAFVSTDEHGRVTSWNREAQRVFDWTAAEAIGSPLAELIIPINERAEHFARVRDSLRPNAHMSRRRRISVSRKDGSVFPAEIAAWVTRVQDQVSLNAFIRDVTADDQAKREKAEMEVQLRQAQKLEAIGHLAAGIAHEINTPTQYIGDNTRFLQDAFADLVSAVDRAAHLATTVRDEPTMGVLAAEICGALDETDIDYLRTEIPGAIEQALDGVARVTEIVHAMKEFSHPGRPHEKTPFDLNRAIQTTITVARNEWKYIAEIETDLDEDLPLVVCAPGEISQVVLNLIVNAAHAIRSKRIDDTAEKGIIRISTRAADDGHAEIRIADTGTGIPEEVGQRVFEPFFTTKEVGKGTGQGLSMAHGIITKNHGGELFFETCLGEGTTFVVRLPSQCAATIAEGVP